MLGETISPISQAPPATYRRPKMLRNQPQVQVYRAARSSRLSMSKHETTSHPMFVACMAQTSRAHLQWIRRTTRSLINQHGLVPHQPVFVVNLQMSQLLQALPVVCQGQPSCQTSVVGQLVMLQAKLPRTKLLLQDVATSLKLPCHPLEPPVSPLPNHMRAYHRTSVRRQVPVWHQPPSLQRMTASLLVR